MRFIKSLAAVGFLSGLLFVSGCANVQSVTYDKEHATIPLKSLTLAKVKDPASYTFMDMSGAPSLLGGAIGGLISADTSASRSSAFNNAVDVNHFHLGEVFAENIKNAFAAKGVEVNYRPDLFPKLSTDNKSDDFSDIATGDDGILVVWITFAGFVDTAKFSNEFYPTLNVTTKLIDPKSKSILYQESFVTGFKNRFIKATYVNIDEDEDKYMFKDAKATVNNFSKAKQAFTASTESISNAIASQLK